MHDRWIQYGVMLFVLSGLAGSDLWAQESAAAAPVQGQTLHLRPDGSWQPLEQNAYGQFLERVAAFKRLINAGEVESALKALELLKADFPGIVGKDLDAYIQAEVQYGQGEWVKAVRQYDEFMDAWPDSWLYESALERQFSIATAYLSGQKRNVLIVLRLSAHEEGAKIMRQVADRAGDAPIAKRALVTLAGSYEKRDEYLDAYETWAEISNRWPTGEMGQTALLEMARCLHTAYRGPSYDPAGLISARSYFQNYQLRYPEDSEQRQIQRQLDLIREQLAYKQYTTGQYYERIGKSEAAHYYFRMVAEKWPDSNAARMAGVKLQPVGSAARQTLEQEKKSSRRIFEATESFLDSWFGIASLFGAEKKGPQEQ
ncbi:MAG: outer membrane protein assembly factor BamD [Sedimentisphaerales bacterium]|nr:outer membrane protein assembly factor BamD [Sedimentisphaerales bacterium]